MPALKKISKKKVAKVNLKFIIDCAQVVTENVLQPKNLSEFLLQKIKVQNKTGNLGDSVKVETDDKRVTVKSSIPLSKRYLKYLAKKYLKKQNLRNFLHVVSTDKNKYEFKFFNIDSKGEDGEE